MSDPAQQRHQDKPRSTRRTTTLTAAPTAWIGALTFKGHNGKYVLTYDWQLTS